MSCRRFPCRLRVDANSSRIADYDIIYGRAGHHSPHSVERPLALHWTVVCAVGRDVTQQPTDIKFEEMLSCKGMSRLAGVISSMDVYCLREDHHASLVIVRRGGGYHFNVIGFRRKKRARKS